MRWAKRFRAFAVLFGSILLTTCSSDALAPRPPVRGALDLSSLIQLHNGFPITVDTILVELRRSDESLAFSQTVPSTKFSSTPGRYTIDVEVKLNESPEQFLLHAEVRGGGVVFYEANSLVTAIAGRSVQTDPIVPVYVGPGIGSDSLELVLVPATVAPGGVSVATAVVRQAGTIIPGVPVEIISDDSTQVSAAASSFSVTTLSAAGTALGSYTISARTPTGLTQASTLTVVPATTGAASIVANTALTQSAIVHQFVGATPSVRVFDANGQPLAGVPVTYAIGSGGGTLTGANQITDTEGDAALTSWQLGQTAGTNTVTATVAGLTPVTFTATGDPTVPLTIVKVSGDAQTDSAGKTLLQPLVAEIRDSFANPVPNANYSWAVTDGTIAPPTGTANAQGRVSASWTLGLVQATPTATLTAGQAQTIFSVTTLFGQPTISLAFAGIPGVGIGLTSVVNVTVNTAPVSRLPVALASSNTGLFTVPAPDTVYINAGQTTGSKTITGISAGTATLTATAPGYTSGTLTVGVQNRQISLPTTLNVPYGQTSSLPIQLPAPAPAGGVTFAIASSDPTRVGVTTPTVTIAAGGQTANATLSGVLPGPSTITVTNAAYVTGTSATTTTASLNVVQTFVPINSSFGGSITINFESNGTPQAAPSPGIPVTITGRHPTCVAAQSPRTIATGVVNVTSALTYGGSATLPCSDTLVVTATNLLSDSVVVSVTATPGITMSINSGGPIGHQLEESANFNLGASNHGGVSVTLTSSDPAAAVLSTSPTVAGTGTLVIPILPGNTFATFYIQSITAANSAITVTASAPNFTNGSVTGTIVTPGVEVFGLTATTTLSTNTAFYSQVGVPNGQLTGVSRAQNVSPGLGTPIVVTAVSQTPTVATIVDSTTTPTGAATGTATIPGGNYYTLGTAVSPYGMTLRPLTAGQDTVTVSIPGFITMTVDGVRGFAVTQPTITVGSNFSPIGKWAAGQRLRLAERDQSWGRHGHAHIQ